MRKEAGKETERQTEEKVCTEIKDNTDYIKVKEDKDTSPRSREKRELGKLDNNVWSSLLVERKNGKTNTEERIVWSARL